MNADEKNKLQIKAKVVFVFLELFNELEKRIKKEFIENVKKKDLSEINKLHFYYGLKAYRVEINYDESSFELKTNNFDKSCDFNTFTLTDINKINNAEKMVEKLIFEVQSIQSSRQVYPLFECIKKLVNMRNVLAHQVSPPKFQARCYIELLSDERICELIEVIDESDVRLMDEQTKQIASNIAYINKINEILNCK